MPIKFKLWHSFVGLGVLLVLQTIALYTLPGLALAWLTLLCAATGAIGLLYVSTEVIEEVRNARRMLILLSVVMIEFVVFFACEYWFLVTVSSTAYPSLPHDAVSMLLHSTMVFVFNPLYLPTNGLGQLLLIINTLSALGLVLFILQNVWQFRREKI